MAIPITVPRLGWSMDEGTFLGWLKQEGDLVRPGEALFVLESDKAAEDVQALDGGFLRLPPEAPSPGDKVQVGQVLAYLVAEGEDLPPAPQKPAEAVPQPVQPAAPVLLTTTTRRKQASSPRARRVAAELGVDWRLLKGSGRNGRVRERDVRAASALAGRLIPHNHVRRTIAARMVAGVTQAAPVTLTTRVDATRLVSLHRPFKGGTAGSPSYTDLVLEMVAVALRQHPLLQAQWREDGLFVPHRIDIAIAVDTEAGLLAPVLRDVDKLTLREISERCRELIAQAQAGQLSAEQMRDATFTVSNLGHLGIDAFTPIIHLPQCAVLGLGRIVREPAVVGDMIVPRERMTLSLTFDHRVVDGAPAARFLATLRGLLEG